LSFGCRKEPHWTSVHTVFLDDSDFDDISPKVVGLPYGIQTGSTQSNRTQSKSSLGLKQGKHEAEDADDEGEFADVNAVLGMEQIVYYTPGSAAVKRNGGDKVLFKVSSKDKNEVIEDSQFIPSSPVTIKMKIGEKDGDDKRLPRLDSEKLSLETEEDDVEDDEYRPCRDLFSAHFDKLASDPKVTSLTFLFFVGPFYFVDYLHSYLELLWAMLPGIEHANDNSKYQITAGVDNLRDAPRKD
jgi:hypothetical protein